MKRQQKDLDEARERWRRFRLQRRRLLRQIEATSRAPSTTAEPTTQTCGRTGQLRPQLHACMHRTGAPALEEGNQRGRIGEKEQTQSAHGARIVWKGTSPSASGAGSSEGKERRRISSFRHCQPISFAEVCTSSLEFSGRLPQKTVHSVLTLECAGGGAGGP